MSQKKQNYHIFNQSILGDYDKAALLSAVSIKGSDQEGIGKMVPLPPNDLIKKGYFLFYQGATPWTHSVLYQRSNHFANICDYKTT